MDGILNGYTSSVDLLKMVTEAYENDMAVFEAAISADYVELFTEAVILNEESEEESKEAAKDKQKENNYMILPLQFATLIMRYWFEQEYDYRTYENFCGIIRSVLPVKIWDRFFDTQSNYSEEPAEELFNMIK